MMPIRRILVVLLALALCRPAAAEPPLALEGPLTQGGLVIGRTAPGATVSLDGRPLRIAADGRFVFGFGRDHGPTADLTVALGGQLARRRLAVGARSYDIQRIDGLPPAQVTPPPEILARIKAEAERINELRRRDSDLDGLFAGWIWPAEGRLSGVYGSQRILNGEPRQPHFGIDIAAPAGAPVVAAADGAVVLAERDLYFTGGTVMIDHGHGVTGVYSHLADVVATVGQNVRKGDPIGLVGATGRATGPHLDFRINWFDQRIDPLLVLPPRN